MNNDNTWEGVKEKLEQLKHPSAERLADGVRLTLLIQTINQALPLLSQEIEKAKEEERERIADWANENCSYDEWGKENPHLFLHDLLEVLSPSPETNETGV